MEWWTVVPGEVVPNAGLVDVADPELQVLQHLVLPAPPGLPGHRVLDHLLHLPRLLPLQPDPLLQLVDLGLQVVGLLVELHPDVGGHSPACCQSLLRLRWKKIVKPCCADINTITIVNL